MLEGALLLLAVYGAATALHVVLPARAVTGYALDESGRPLRYRLNGLLVFVLVVAGYAGLAAVDLIAWDVFYRHRLALVAAAFVLGLLFTFAIVLPGKSTGRSLLADLYLGRLENPQAFAGRIDAKMLLYLIGAVMLELCILSFGAHHYLAHRADPSPGVLLYVALFSFFLLDYLVFERVHLYTYDFVAERVGFKLGWGCLVFYPFFYCIGLWYAADRPNPHPHPALLFGACGLFFAGWVLARGANLQKFLFKTEPSRRAFGPIAQRALVRGDQRVLVSGFWGLSRHINYLGELCMATALALCLGHPAALLPWLYPLYYVLLLVPRQLDDDRRCAAKYGPLWDEYRRAVPYRIVPRLY
jgi:protein-S-isoprenylcysteine O-methyltransferase Ste14